MNYVGDKELFDFLTNTVVVNPKPELYLEISHHDDSVHNNNNGKRDNKIKKKNPIKLNSENNLLIWPASNRNDIGNNIYFEVFFNPHLDETIDIPAKISIPTPIKAQSTCKKKSNTDPFSLWPRIDSENMIWNNASGYYEYKFNSQITSTNSMIYVINIEIILNDIIYKKHFNFSINSRFDQYDYLINCNFELLVNDFKQCQDINSQSSKIYKIPNFSSSCDMWSYITPIIRNIIKFIGIEPIFITSKLISFAQEKYDWNIHDFWKNEIDKFIKILKSSGSKIEKNLIEKQLIHCTNEKQCIDLLESKTLFKNLQLYRLNNEGNITIMRKSFNIFLDCVTIEISEFHTDTTIWNLLTNNKYHDKLLKMTKYNTLSFENNVYLEDNILRVLDIPHHNLLSDCYSRVEFYFNDPIKKIIINQ